MSWKVPFDDPIALADARGCRAFGEPAINRREQFTRLVKPVAGYAWGGMRVGEPYSSTK
jgi:hypothetical protein